MGGCGIDTHTMQRVSTCVTYCYVLKCVFCAVWHRAGDTERCVMSHDPTRSRRHELKVSASLDYIYIYIVIDLFAAHVG